MLSPSVFVEREYIPDGKFYTIMMTIGEVQQPPEGKKFPDEVMPQVSVISRRMRTQGSQEAISHAEEMPKAPA